MAKCDYICCDDCDCKFIYDGYAVARDNFDENKPPMLVCGDCAAKKRASLAAAKATIARQRAAMEGAELSIMREYVHRPSGGMLIEPAGVREALATIREALAP
jgi:hypothetical protein